MQAHEETPSPEASPRTKAILLGTAGGPGIRGARRQPATAIVVDDDVYLVDCGNGVARAIFEAGLSLRKLRAVFVTHHHSDHVADYGALLLLAWGNGLETPVATIGPPPLRTVNEALWRAYDADLAVRVAEEGRPPLRPLVSVSEIQADGVAYEDERVKVTAAVVDHGAMKPAFAFRFEAADRSIAVSGDTAFSPNLIRLADTVDLLVHEALYVPGLDRLLSHANNATRLRAHIVETHTATEDVGRVAAAANVKALVLTHLVPAADPSIADEDWLAGVKLHYGGPCAVGHDLGVY